MKNSLGEKRNKSKKGGRPGMRQPKPIESFNQPDPLPTESDEGISVSEETHGNRVEEKIEKRARKKREMHEEAKSVAGSEAHHDARNESPDSGPAPLDRY
ncbi:MAG TPA: hypothetical protein VF780_06230 [Nitrosospira sp.]